MDAIEQVARFIHGRHGFYAWEKIDDGYRDLWFGTAEAVIEMIAERDRLAAAIEAIPRHEPCRTSGWVTVGICEECGADWPCPTERAHIAATQSTASAEDRAATDGAGSRLPHGEGPHDADVAPAGVAEGTLPAPKDDNKEAMP